MASEVLGLTNIAVTKDIYGHLVAEAQAGGLGSDEFGAVWTGWLPGRCVMLIRLGTSGPEMDIGPCQGRGLVLARPEGFEPPTF